MTYDLMSRMAPNDLNNQRGSTQYSPSALHHKLPNGMQYYVGSIEGSKVVVELLPFRNNFVHPKLPVHVILTNEQYATRTTCGTRYLPLSWAATVTFSIVSRLSTFIHLQIVVSVFFFSSFSQFEPLLLVFFLVALDLIVSIFKKPHLLHEHLVKDDLRIPCIKTVFTFDGY